MKVFVTGANGFIGSFLTEALLAQGHEVHCLVRSSSNLRWIADLDIECHFGDLFNKDVIQSALRDVDYIYHIAGTTKAFNKAGYFKTNYEGTKSLLETIISAGIDPKRFLLVSSLAAAGPSPAFEAIDEKKEPNPVTWYGESKLAAERYARTLGAKIDVTIVRPPVVYGPRDRDVLEFFKTVKKGIIPQLQGKERYASIIHVKDLVRGVLAAAESEKTRDKTYFLANPQPCSWQEIANTTLKIMGKKGIRLPVPLTALKAVAAVSELLAKLMKTTTIVNRQKVIEMQQDFWICSPGHARRDFNFETEITLEQGISETIDWYAKNGWL